MAVSGAHKLFFCLAFFFFLFCRSLFLDVTLVIQSDLFFITPVLFFFFFYRTWYDMRWYWEPRWWWNKYKVYKMLYGNLWSCTPSLMQKWMLPKWYGLIALLWNGSIFFFLVLVVFVLLLSTSEIPKLA